MNSCKKLSESDSIEHQQENCDNLPVFPDNCDNLPVFPDNCDNLRGIATIPPLQKRETCQIVTFPVPRVKPAHPNMACCRAETMEWSWK